MEIKAELPFATVPYITLSAALSKLWGDATLWWWIQNIMSGEGQTLREGECATCRGVYQKRDMLLYLKMLFFSKFIADPDKQDLFIYFMAITGFLRTVYSDRFSPQKRLFAEHFRVLLLKIQNFKNIFKCRNIQLFLFRKPKPQLSNY